MADFVLSNLYILTVRLGMLTEGSGPPTVPRQGKENNFWPPASPSRASHYKCNN